MGYLDYFQSNRGSGGVRRSLSSFFSQPQQQQPAQAGQSRGRGFPERIDLGNPFHQGSEAAVDIFESAGRYPGQVTETPVALLETAARRALGVSPIAAIGQIPGVGAAIGALGEGIERIGNFVPSLLNAQDMRMIEEFGDKPDDFELPWQSGQRTEGAPILGAIPGLGTLFSKAKTIGELKRELEKRNFMVDPETGEQRSWDKLVRELRGGNKSVFDFGYASINDNPLVDLSGRIALDPTNLLFAIPGANIVKGGQAVGKVGQAIGAASDAQNILRASRNIVPAMERAGLRAAKLPPPVVAKEAVANADIANITLRGTASFYKDILAYPTSAALRGARAVTQRALDPRGYIGLGDGALTAGTTLGRAGQAVARGARGYAVSSTALSAGLAGVGAASGIVDEVAGGNTFFQGIHDFVLDVENSNPLSESAAWTLASAFSFPYGDAVRQTRSTVATQALNAFGSDFEVALSDKFGFGKTPAGRELFREAIGGPQEVNTLIAYLVKHNTARVVGHRPLLGARINSAPNAAVRARWADETLASVGLNRLRGNKISGDDLSAAIEDWHAEQMGFKQKGGKGDQSLVGDARRAPFVPELALRRWKRYATAQSTVGRGMQEMADGVMGLGLRDHLFREQFSEIHTRLKNAVDDNGIVSQAAIREVLEDYPALGISDSIGYWKNAALDDAKPLTWNSVRSKLGKQGKHADSIDDLLAQASIKEQAAGLDDGPSGFEPADSQLSRLSDELDQHRDGNGNILENDRTAAIQSELQGTLARQQEVAATKRFATDKAQGGQQAAETLAKLEKQSALPELPLNETTWWFDAELKMQALDWERAILEIDPTYTVKALPKNQVLVQMRPTDSGIYHALKGRTLLGELLFDRGPLSPFTGFVKKALAPVRGDKLARQARQHLYETMIPEGAKPEQVNRWIGKMQEMADAFSFENRGQRFGLYRDVSSLPASAINKAAVEAFGPTSKIVARHAGKFQNLLDTASSRQWRSIRTAVRKGGKKGEYARALEAFHDFYQEGPVISAVSSGGRMVSKTFYNLFRFLMDPRWIALNLAERNFLGAAKDGIVRGARKESAATRFYESGASRIDDAALAGAGDTGWYYGRGLMSHVGRSFDARRGESTIATLDALGKSDAGALNTIRTRMRREAEGDLAAARRAKEAGDDVDLTEVERRANLDIENSNRDLSELLDQKLYDFDQKGVRKTITDEAQAILDSDELTVMEPLLNALYEMNEESWQNVNRLYHGNPERNTMERLANSYWFYWPISYQVKALKWLSGAMLDGSFGHNNGALLAGKYAVWQEQHRERMKNNPAYAAMFEENPEMWFMAQMVLPITPGDIGVSLSRPVRLVGGMVTDQVVRRQIDEALKAGVIGKAQHDELLTLDPNKRHKEWAPIQASMDFRAGKITDEQLKAIAEGNLGAFAAYAQSRGPLSAATYITDLGPIYTWHLLQDLEDDARGVDRFEVVTEPEPEQQPLSFDSLPRTFTLPASPTPSTP